VGTLPREDLLRQLLGRLHRFGQAREQRAIFLVGRGSVHEAMWDRWAAVHSLQVALQLSDWWHTAPNDFNTVEFTVELECGIVFLVGMRCCWKQALGRAIPGP
jgi:hypothetical protein